MFVNYRCFYLCLFSFLIAFLTSTALFCSNLTASDQRDTPCFLESATPNPVVLRSSGNSLVLPCHVARSKRSTVEWWFTDSRKSGNIKIYPIFPPVRPTVLRFVTSLTPYSKSLNETDILDASILLRNVNVDDTGLYRCIIRPWTIDPFEPFENTLSNDESNIESLNYLLELNGPRLCQSNPGSLPCFTAMRTSSPTILDAYQTAFLQCVVKAHTRPISVFWVVGNSSVNSVLVTDFLTTNQYNGDRLRRVFPLSPVDHSIELSVNSTTYERSYSCVIEGATDRETTIFTYIVRTIDAEDIENKTVKKMNQSLLEDLDVTTDAESFSEENASDVGHEEEEETSTAD